MKCILPWINYGTNTFGRTRICGYSDSDAHWKKIFDKYDCEYPPTKPPPDHLEKERFTSDYVIWLHKLQKSDIDTQWNNLYYTDIRNTFLRNEWPENCKRCKYVEDNGGVSKRNRENHIWFDKYKDLIERTDSEGFVDYYPPHLDVRTGTVCNFKCIHCSPGASSRWMEDFSIIDKFKEHGYEHVEIDNRWIAQENYFWDSLNIQKIKRYNFLGGESFFNKKHNEFIKKLSESSYAKEVEVMYVTNGSLLTEDVFEILKNFKKIKIRISVDVIKDKANYFRFGINWDDWVKNCKYANNYVKENKNFDIAFQWTCSNISLFYLVESYEYLANQFNNIRFLFENHVTHPVFLSASNLPNEIKKMIKDEINFYFHKHKDKEKIDFYVNHMYSEDNWEKYKNVLVNYLNDLDNKREVDWKKCFYDMEIEKYVEKSRN